jgi:biopolymer transport protein ExbB
MRRGVVVFLICFVVFSSGLLAFAQEEKTEVTEETAAAEAEAEAGMTFGQLLVAGGPIMIIILFCSIATVSLGIWYAIDLRTSNYVSPAFVTEVEKEIADKQPEKAIDVCRANTESVLARLLETVIRKRSEAEAVVDHVVEDIAGTEAANLEQRISYLSQIAVVSPMLGLLGTVTGMIQAFNVIAFSAGLGKPTLLAAGVSQALITTAAGLIVGIPAMVLYFFFRGQIHKIMSALENTTDRFMALVRG